MTTTANSQTAPSVGVSETLGYVCKATKTRHNAEGFVYRNRWATGAQDLIFPSHEAAKAWADFGGPADVKIAYQGPAA